MFNGSPLPFSFVAVFMYKRTYKYTAIYQKGVYSCTSSIYSRSRSRAPHNQTRKMTTKSDVDESLKRICIQTVCEVMGLSSTDPQSLLQQIGTSSNQGQQFAKAVFYYLQYKRDGSLPEYLRTAPSGEEILPLILGDPVSMELLKENPGMVNQLKWFVQIGPKKEDLMTLLQPTTSVEEVVAITMKYVTPYPLLKRVYSRITIDIKCVLENYH
jgi:hypothetical protein